MDHAVLDDVCDGNIYHEKLSLVGMPIDLS